MEKLDSVKCICDKHLNSDANLYRVNDHQFKCPYCGHVRDVNTSMLNAIPIEYDKNIALVIGKIIVFKVKREEILLVNNAMYVNVPRSILEKGAVVYYLDDDFSFSELEEMLNTEIITQ